MTTKALTYPFVTKALKVEQPLGPFWVAVLPYELLNKTCQSEPLRIDERESMGYDLMGIQRKEKIRRLKEIGRYIDTVEAAFPNTIIIAANTSPEDMVSPEEDSRGDCWSVRDKGENVWELRIPTGKKISTIIDGQHRLHGFEYASRAEMDLLCSIYLDLPKAYQAYLFATINFNQQKVERSLAYELFGFNLDDEPEDTWSPEKAAVYLSRRMNTAEDSPFRHHIFLAAQDDDTLSKVKASDVQWAVSTATVVDGILRLISKNPRRDRDTMHKIALGKGRSRSILATIEDDSPLRQLYIKVNDRAIYLILINFFAAVDRVFWKNAKDNSYIFKTVGIQALFQVLRKILPDILKGADIRMEVFANTLSSAGHIDFTKDIFQASGIGVTNVRTSILLAIGKLSMEEIPNEDRAKYQEVIRN